MLLLNRQDVESLLDLDQLVDALADAMAELSAGRVSMPARVAARVSKAEGLLGAMPAYLSSSDTLAVKLVSVFPQNERRGLPSHQAVILVFDAWTGAPLAMMEGGYITAVRTAGGSALATRLLARPESSVLTIIGTGVEARAHARAIPRVRTIREIRIVGRTLQKAEALSAEIASAGGIRPRAFVSSVEAAQGADIICATTHAAEPVVLGRWLAPGMHVNSVGFNTAGKEVDGAAIVKSLLVVESRGVALAPPPAGANEISWAIRDGLISAQHIHAEVGELVSGSRPGRTSPDQITLYKSVGVAVQDAAAANLVLQAARARRMGKEVET
jgi:ornithine cyclodeaminase/alanine dehydrogenase-like protein (mu-crystallin family)